MSILYTPVVFIIFNRPDLSAKVFEEIRRARPSKLFIVADGPRPDYPEDIQKCMDARSVADQVDWACDVRKNYSETNLGCEHRVSSGLNWVFDNSEEAIILEDDCLPDQNFFRFCQEILERYRENPHVMVVSSCNFQYGNKREPYSYYFSRFHHPWGWATWRRAWNHFDFDMKQWPAARDAGWLANKFPCRRLLKDIWRDDVRTVRFWTNTFQQTYESRKNTWDYRWVFACFLKEGITVMPDRNLVTNIGFGEGATHTKNGRCKLMLSEVPMVFPLKHPPEVVCDIVADRLMQRYHFATSFFCCLRQKVLNLLKPFF